MKWLALAFLIWLSLPFVPVGTTRSMRFNLRGFSDHAVCKIVDKDFSNSTSTVYQISNKTVITPPELQKIRDLEQKVGRLIMEIQNDSWDLTEARRKAYIENFMDELVEHANSLDQMKYKPIELKEYIDKHGTDSAYKSMNTFLKAKGFVGNYKVVRIANKGLNK